MSRVDAAELFEGFDRFALSLSSDDDELFTTKRWLSVAIDVRKGSRVWSQEDSCLTVEEAGLLAEWMERVARSDDVERCQFREGNLAFELADGRLFVECDLEFAPPEWDEPERGFRFDVALDDEQAQRFADTLRCQLEHLDDEQPPVEGPLIPPPPRRPSQR